MKAVKTLTCISTIASVLLWILGLSFLAFNLLGMWVAWLLAGFAYYFYFLGPHIVSIVSLILSAKQKDADIRTKYLLINGVVFVISIIMTCLAFTVFQTWFW